MNNNLDFKMLVVKKDNQLHYRIVYQNLDVPTTKWEEQGLQRAVESVSMPEVRLHEAYTPPYDNGDMLFVRGYNNTYNHIYQCVGVSRTDRALNFFKDINKKYSLINQ
jgi:hypothetical protein